MTSRPSLFSAETAAGAPLAHRVRTTTLFFDEIQRYNREDLDLPDLEQAAALTSCLAQEYS